MSGHLYPSPDSARMYSSCGRRGITPPDGVDQNNRFPRGADAEVSSTANRLNAELMKILVTGADGFIGRALVARLLSSGMLPGLGDARRQVTLLDHTFASPVVDARARLVTGDLADERVQQEAAAG